MIDSSIGSIRRYLRPPPEREVALFRLEKRRHLLTENLKGLLSLQGVPEKIVSKASCMSDLPSDFDWEAEENRTLSNIPKSEMIALGFNPSLFDADKANRILTGCIDYFARRGRKMDELRARRKFLEINCLSLIDRSVVIKGMQGLIDEAEESCVQIEGYKTAALADALGRLASAGPRSRNDIIAEIISGSYYYTPL